MKDSMNKDIRQMVRAAQKRGWELENHSKHDSMVHTSGARVFIARTPSDYRGIANVRQELKRVERAAATAE